MSVRKISLDGEWILSNEKKDIELSAIVPGTVFEELIKAKKIEEPFYGLNENKNNIVYESKWKYEKSFFPDKKLLEMKNISIKFHGLDTFASIYLNGRKIEETDNMHRTYEVPIKGKSYSLLLPGENKITVVFDSATKNASDLLEKMEIKHDDPCSLPGVEMLRKAYYSFGWDWGPKLPDIGIWRSVEIIAWNEIKLEEFKIESVIDFLPMEKEKLPEAGKATFKFEAEVNFSEEESPEGYFLEMEMSEVDGKELGSAEFSIGKKHQKWETKIEFPKLWWSHDLGPQNLYHFTLKLKKDGEILDSISKKTGIRKIELIREPDKWGETFYFKLNNIPLFAKGADWIPVDSFIPRGKKLGLYRQNLESAKEANMNMLRVWGGGIYEDNEFYDLCDRLGILVWQDFAFACKVQPDYPGYLENVKAEAIDNIKRLHHHPSLAIWVGNNEIEEGWVHWGFEDRVPELKSFYLEIFEKLLPQLVNNYDGTRPYWPSSPSSGGKFEEPQSANSGDSHYWKVWHAMYPFSSYREFDSRFMSEFGFESFPSLKTINSFCPPEEQSIYSKIMENHQKNQAGNKKIFDYMEQRFTVPKDFSKQVILSQLTQAEAMEYGVEYWRRNRNDFHCMGALYWQLNDCWPVASWSSLDYFGRWKALHYFAKRFYSPVFISAEESPAKLKIWITNDLPSTGRFTAEWSIWDKRGNPIYGSEREVSAPPLKSMAIDELELESILRIHDLKDLIVFFKVLDEKGKVLSAGSRLFVPPSAFELSDPKLEYNLVKEDDHNYEIEIFSTEIALYVYLESDKHDFILDDNFFSMTKGETRKLHLKTKESVDEKELKEKLHIGSLYNLIH